LAISGDGFFVMKDESGNNATYTRAGDFEESLVGDGSTFAFLGPDGKYLHGTSGSSGGTASTMITLPSDIQSYTISNKGSVSYVDGTGSLVDDAFTIDIANFAGKGGLKQVGGNQYAETTSSGNPFYTSTDYDVYQGYLENSNVDLAKEFTEMIVAERGFQANSRTITTSDSMLQELLNLKR
jgi:flagellar hook protein FlgE